MSKKPLNLYIRRAGELNWLFGVILVALGVAICNRANLGVSMISAPAFIIHEAVSSVTSLSLGVIEYLVQGFVILLTCIIVRRLNWRYLLSFLTAVIYGYAIDLWMLIIGTEPFQELWLRWVMLIVGDVAICLGVAFFFRTYLPVEAYELCVHEVSRVFRFKTATVKWVFDFCCLAVSIVLAFSLFGDVTTFDWSTIYATSFHYIGLGTVVTTLISAPIIRLLGVALDKFIGVEPFVKPLFKFIHISDSGRKKSTPAPQDEVSDQQNSSSDNQQISSSDSQQEMPFDDNSSDNE